MRAEDLTAAQLIEALHAVYTVIAVPLAVFDEDEPARMRALFCRTMATESYLDALLGIVGDELPFDDFTTWLAGLSMMADEWPVRYTTWDDVDNDETLRAAAAAQEWSVASSRTTP